MWLKWVAVFHVIRLQHYCQHFQWTCSQLRRQKIGHRHIQKLVQSLKLSIMHVEITKERDISAIALVKFYVYCPHQKLVFLFTLLTARWNRSV